MKVMFVRFHQVCAVFLCILFSGIAGTVPKDLPKKTCPDGHFGIKTGWHRKACPNDLDLIIIYKKSELSEITAEKARALCSIPENLRTEWHQENCLYLPDFDTFKKNIE